MNMILGAKLEFENDMTKGLRKLLKGQKVGRRREEQMREKNGLLQHM